MSKKKEQPTPIHGKATEPTLIGVKRITISDRYQYGDSFEVTFEKSAKDVTSEIAEADLKKILDLPEIEPSLKVFLKVPWWDRALRADDERLKEEIEKEFFNKDSINSAKERIEQRNNASSPLSDPKAPQYRFNIAKMLGHAVPSEIITNKELIGVFYEHVNGRDLEKSGFKQACRSIKNSRDLLNFSLELAYAVQKIHNQSIAHSFIVPRNIILKKVDDQTARSRFFEFYIVGFGYARLGDTIGRDRRRNPQFEIAENDKLYLAPECKSPNSYGPFWFPADIYSIGAVLYALLCYYGRHSDSRGGKDQLSEKELKALIDSVLKDPPRDVARLKRLIRTNLQQAAGDIIDGNENILKIIDHCLRYNPEDRFSCAEELIEIIEIALLAEPSDYKAKTLGSKAMQKSMIEALKVIRKEETSSVLRTILLSPPSGGNDYSSNSFFDELVREMQSDFRTDLAKMQSGHLEIYGSRDKIITSLCRMLCVSGEGYEYNTMTIPHYWLDMNLGPLGRFLTMNKHMARHGLKIKRLFLVDTDNFHLLDSDEQQMLLDHFDAQKDVTMRLAHNLNGGEFDVRVLPVSPDEINTFERDGKTVGYLSKIPSAQSGKKGQERREKSVPADLCLSFYSSTSVEWDYGKEYVNRRIAKVRYWVPHPEDETKKGKLDSAKDLFGKYWDRALPLEAYISRGYAKRHKTVGGSMKVEPLEPETMELTDLLKPDEKRTVAS